MIITDIALRELRDAFVLWALGECAEGRPYPAQHDWEVVCQTAKQWGAPHAKSAFARAFKTLVDEKRIKPKQQPRPVEVTLEFRQRVARMSASGVRVAYQRDPEFRKLWDAMSLEDDRSVRIAEPEQEYELTAQMWRSLPPTVAAIKMRDARFRAAVDRLIQKGEI